MPTKITISNLDPSLDYSSLATAVFAKANVAANTANSAYEVASTFLKVTSIVYPGNDTAADTAGGQTITLTGSGFVSGASVLINGSAVGVVSVANSTTLTFTSPSANSGSYVIYVVNPDGATAISIPGIQYSGTPTWTTAAGSLGSLYETAAFGNTVIATGDTVTYSLQSGTLPPGATFSSNGTITGTSSTLSSPTTYTFTVRATDAQNQDTDRSFSITINPDAVTWSSPTTNTSYTLTPNVAMSNVTLVATSAAGASIFYSANTLPTGVSLTGNTIFGTPTVSNQSTTSLVTATANTTSESSSIVLNWTVSVASDPYFMYNSLLLSGDGTNGAQNNTFLDGSTNNFTITRNGNTTQGTFSPYGPNWSNYFDGNGDYLSASGAITNSGTGDFSFEAWVYYTGTYANYNFVFDSRASGSPTTGFNVALDITTGYWYWGQSAQELLTSTPCPKNAWVHICATRQSGVIRLFQNGILIGYVANTSNLTNTGALIGTYYSVNNYYWPGYISNLRVQKNSVPISYQTSNTTVGTSIFTPQTTPLTAITNTSLLTCQSNRFIDNSTNNFTITKFGDTSVQRFSPFSPTATYSASTIGGSAYFDGTGDYLSAPSNAAFNVSSNNVTAEAWVYLTAFNTAGNPFISTIWSLDSSGSNNTFAYVYNTGSIAVGINGVNEIASSAGVIKLGAWYHTAVVRNGSTTTIYVNGVSVASNTTSVWANTGARPFLVGSTSQSANYYLNGYISNVRFVNGTAVYTSAFTPPTAPVTAISGTSLLLNFTNAGIFDNTMMNDLETVGDAKISTAQSKFGGGSMSFDGTGDWLVCQDSPNQEFGSGNLTWEMWIYTATTTQYATLYSRTPASFLTGMWSWMMNQSSSTAGDLALYVADYSTSSPLLLTTGVNIRDSAWHHIAVVRNGSAWAIYVDGTSRATATWAGTIANIAGSPYIGADQFYGRAFTGYIDDLRITKGYARYTSNFTPPTTAHAKL